MRARKTLPWKPPSDDESDISDYRFGLLCEKVQQTQPTWRARKGWISNATWELVDQRAQLKCAGEPAEVLAAMNHRIRQSLKTDRQARVSAAGVAIESALEADELQDAWNTAKAWYRQASGRAPKPSRLDFEELHKERTELYRAVPP